MPSQKVYCEVQTWELTVQLRNVTATFSPHLTPQSCLPTSSSQLTHFPVTLPSTARPSLLALSSLLIHDRHPSPHTPIPSQPLLPCTAPIPSLSTLQYTEYHPPCRASNSLCTHWTQMVCSQYGIHQDKPETEPSTKLDG